MATTNKGRKKGEGCCASFMRKLGPRLTQCGLGWGLLPYQVASSYIQPFDHNRRSWLLSNTTLLGRGLPPYQVPSWSIQPFVHNRHGPKIGGSTPFGGGGPHLTQCRLGWGLPPFYQVACWSIQPFGQNRYGPKIGGGGAPPLLGRVSWVPI